MTFYYSHIHSPLGCLKLIASDHGLAAILWENEANHPQEKMEAHKTSILIETEKQLENYFQGKRKEFDLPLDIHGSPLQKKVWDVLQTIPYGTTLSYRDIATRIGKPNAYRAAGTAIGKNPLSIVIPCHRVIGSNGKLTGFAGGLDAKAFLLRLEGISVRTENALK